MTYQELISYLKRLKTSIERSASIRQAKKNAFNNIIDIMLALTLETDTAESRQNLFTQIKTGLDALVRERCTVTVGRLSPAQIRGSLNSESEFLNSLGLLCREKIEWERLFKEHFPKYLTDKASMLGAFRDAKFLTKNGAINYVPQNEAELDHILSSIDEEGSEYDIRDIRGYLYSGGFTEDEVAAMKKSDVVIYASAIFAAQSDFSADPADPNSLENRYMNLVSVAVGGEQIQPIMDDKANFNKSLFRAAKPLILQRQQVEREQATTTLAMIQEEIKICQGHLIKIIDQESFKLPDHGQSYFAPVKNYNQLVADVINNKINPEPGKEGYISKELTIAAQGYKALEDIKKTLEVPSEDPREKLQSIAGKIHEKEKTLSQSNPDTVISRFFKRCGYLLANIVTFGAVSRNMEEKKEYPTYISPQSFFYEKVNTFLPKENRHFKNETTADENEENPLRLRK